MSLAYGFDEFDSFVAMFELSFKDFFSVDVLHANNSGNKKVKNILLVVILQK